MSVASKEHSTFTQPSMGQTLSSPTSSDQLSGGRRVQAAHESFATSILRALAVFGLGGWFYYDLSRLESGEIESTRVWAPIAMLYDTLGFWPAVCLLPAVGCFIVFRASSSLVTGANPETV